MNAEIGQIRSYEINSRWRCVILMRKCVCFERLQLYPWMFVFSWETLEPLLKSPKYIRDITTKFRIFQNRKGSVIPMEWFHAVTILICYTTTTSDTITFVKAMTHTVLSMSHTYESSRIVCSIGILRALQLLAWRY